MAFLDSLSKAAKNLGEMAGDAIDNGKLNIKIMEEKAKISEAYAELGQTVYNQYKNGTDESIKINELLQKIDGHNQAIEEAQAQAGQPEQAPVVNQAEPVVGGGAAPEGAKFCSGCGAKLDGTSRFCGSCGTPV